MSSREWKPNHTHNLSKTASARQNRTSWALLLLTLFSELGAASLLLHVSSRGSYVCVLGGLDVDSHRLEEEESETGNSRKVSQKSGYQFSFLLFFFIEFFSSLALYLFLTVQLLRPPFFFSFFLSICPVFAFRGRASSFVGAALCRAVLCCVTVMWTSQKAVWGSRSDGRRDR